MADEQKPGGSEAPSPPVGEGAKPPAKPAADAAKPAPPKPAAAAPPKPPATMAATPWDSDLARAVKERFGDGILATSTYLGQNFVVTRPESAVPVLEYLKLEADFDYLVDITAVDWPKRAERFDLVYIVYSFPHNQPRPHQDPNCGWIRAGHRDRCTPDGQLAGARGVRHVRHPLRRPSGPTANPDAGRLAGLPFAQGLRHPAAGRTLGCRKPGHRKRPVKTCRIPSWTRPN